MILVTHDLSIIADLCNKVIIYYAGKIAEMGSSLSRVFKAIASLYSRIISFFSKHKSEKAKTFIHSWNTS
jgi:ABC-type dipeptide/oligopeptide/nickel transport system, ATPase component